MIRKIIILSIVIYTAPFYAMEQQLENLSIDTEKAETPMSRQLTPVEILNLGYFKMIEASSSNDTVGLKYFHFAAKQNTDLATKIDAACFLGKEYLHMGDYKKFVSAKKYLTIAVEQHIPQDTDETIKSRKSALAALDQYHLDELEQKQRFPNFKVEKSSKKTSKTDPRFYTTLTPLTAHGLGVYSHYIAQDFQTAEQYYLAAIALNDSAITPAAQLNLGALYVQQGKINKAQALCPQIIEKNINPALMKDAQEALNLLLKKQSPSDNPKGLSTNSADAIKQEESRVQGQYSHLWS